MKHFLVLTLNVLLASCSGDEESAPETFSIELNSQIMEHPGGGLEYEVFCVEEGALQQVNTQSNPLKPFSLGVMTYMNTEGRPTGLGLASLTSDLEFVSVNEQEFDQISTFPDSLHRFTLSIDATENQAIGIISKTRQFKVRIKAAIHEVKGSNRISKVILQGEYL